MASERLIGFDVGTTAVKAAVFDKSGAVKARFVENYPTQRRGIALVEQDPEDWVRLIKKALSIFDGNEIAAIGLCSQVNTHIFVDSDGNALGPAIVWKDRRASDEAASLDAQVTLTQKKAWKGTEAFDPVMYDEPDEHKNSTNSFVLYVFTRQVKIFNFASLSAISNVPTPSMLAAMIGIPVYSCLLFLNFVVLNKSTSLRDLSVDLLGLMSTSE